MQIETGQGTMPIKVLIAIYSISMLTSLPGLAISPILGNLETIFKGATQLQLQMLESLPSLLIVPSILLAGKLSIHLDKKRLLTIGLSIFFVCSIVYLFSQTMALLLLVSALLGVGAGMVVPFTTGLIADYFSGARRTQQLGIVSAITNLTLVMATFLAGFLADINWHLPFLVYCFSAISLAFAFYLPRKTPVAINPTPPAASEPISPEITAIVEAIPIVNRIEARIARLDWPIRLMGLYFLITFLALTIPFNLAIYMENLHIGDSGTSGTLISVFFLSMTLPGFFINKVIAWLKDNTNFFAMIAIAAGLLLFIVSHSLITLTGAVILTGLGYGIMQPIIYDKTASRVQPVRVTFALSLVMSMNYIAIIVYPFMISGLQNLFNANASTFPFFLNAIVAVGFVVFVYFKRKTKTFDI